MRHVFLALTAATALVGCGDGNPFTSTGDTTAAFVSINGTGLDSEMTADSVVYDDKGTPNPSDDTLVINNLPFDGSDVAGGEYTRRATLPNAFDVYESPTATGVGSRQYFAVFQRTANVQATAVGTNDYVTAGFGGLVAERLTTGNVPAARPANYTFTGDYAGIRVYRDTSSGAGAFLTVTGDATLVADIPDFDTTGAVETIIDNRMLYTIDGVFVANLTDFLTLATAEINFDNATISQSTAESITGLTVNGTGNWSGIFAGPNGEEVAGIVVINGTVSTAESGLIGLPTGTSVRENGVFIVFNGG